MSAAEKPETAETAENAEKQLLIHYPEELPVSMRREEIAAALSENQVVIVAGATGSGKTTQLPKILLELGRTSIGHTQPRRIAARTIAERIAEELGQEVGGIVGYQVRFTDRVGKNTRIKLMTDGILLNEIHRDRELRKYDAIIIDEAHERSLTVDFLLGYLKQLLPRRPDLKLVITSATIDPGSFSRHFGDAPIIEVSGRTYPVEIRYRPLVAEVTEDEDADPATAADQDPIEGINAAIDELAREGTGDVLVFLSGENEIRDAEEAIRARHLPHTEVLPLYGRLSAADQHRVFQLSTTAGTRRRIVLATNVAETSLTVPGIKYVIDAGTARISRYSVRSKVQRLPIEAISQASANQRSGRSGRTSDGIAIRLYSEEDFARRPEYTEPEILRTNLAAVILQMISLGLGDIANFPFLQPPDSRGIKDGLDLLTELGAIRGSGSGSGSAGAGGSGANSQATAPQITRIGRQLSQLPIDPRLARMVLESKQHGTTREVMAIVAGLSIQDPRERPLEKRPQADQAHARFVDPTSDFLTLLNLWNYLKEKEKELSGNQFRRLCRSEYLNYLRVREWADVYRQLERMAKQLDLTIGQPSVNPAGIHRSLLAGLLSQIGIKDAAAAATATTRSAPKKTGAAQKRGEYIGARQVRFTVFPGSALAKKQPAEIMSAELVETSRLFARMNAAIDLAWAEPIAGDLVKRSYSEPHWEKKQGSAVANERVTLYGVPIIAKRRVQFARIDPAYARELFIRHALVEGDWDIDRLDRRLSAFDRANRELRRELAELEERTRRRDILYDDEAVFEFYTRRIPADVASQRSFETWWRAARVDTPDLLTMTAEALVDEPDDTSVDLVESSFPSTWRQGDQTLALSYRFEPGAEDDGVTVQVPLPLLARLSPDGFDWQVPGFREELVTALLKSLPKAIRRNVVPAGDWARKLLAELPPEPGPLSLRATLAAAITRLTYIPVAASDFDETRIPGHLQPTFAVADERGRVVGHGKELIELQERLKSRVRESVAKASVTPRSNLERAGLTGWDFEELPKLLDTQQGGNTIRAYPALVDNGSSVAIQLMSTPEDQARELRKGVRRLLLLAVPSPTGYVQEHLTTAEKLTLAQSPYRTTAELFADCLAACVDGVLGDTEVWTRAQFESVRDAVSATIVDSLFHTVSQVTAIVSAARTAEKAIKGASSVALLAPLADAREQLNALVYPGFVSATGAVQLRRLPLYLSGITHRIGKLAENLGRDRVWMTEVQTATERYSAAGGRLPLAQDSPHTLARARWLLEELRLSLFAQHLGTAEPVSLQRITKVLAGG
jgi:ATP-dependent helicase HrpA